jgi:DNA mismatch repair ATPase MutS
LTNIFTFLMLWDLHVYMLTISRVRAKRAEFLRAFELVGDLDATICVASFLAQPRMRVHCFPSMTNEALIDIADGYHPLLAAPVPNSLRLHRRSALVSGSNMAGKTTFIKMIGTNIILGRTIGICLATRAIIPSTSVRTNIISEHSIASGKSRYLSETERVLSFISDVQSAVPQVLLIDEIFSGTNTRERVAAAYAVLKALSAQAVVLATTHDVELHAKLAKWFEMFSFVEDAGVEGYFDYRARRGAAPFGNGIRLLEKVGFPRSIVDDAISALADGGPNFPSDPASGKDARRV